MAITQNPIVGRMHGTLGNAVASKWKGRNTLRSKALTVANPQTDAQMKQRSKFDIVLGFARIFSVVIRVGFKEVATTISEYNAFMSENMLNDFLGYVSNAWVADHSKLVLAKGSLDVTIASSTASNASADTITINFPTSPAGNQSNADKFFAICGTDTAGGNSAGTVTRNDGTAVITLDHNLVSGDVVKGYYFFQSADGKKVSNSQYFTLTV